MTTEAQVDAHCGDLLRTIATHWPGTMTGYCMGCDDEPWPCQTVLDIVVPVDGSRDD